jgi:hypothetical protein
MATLTTPDKIMTMPEAQAYLVDHGVPVKSRSSFYRLIEDPQYRELLPYIDLTPSSRYANRRFRQGDLDKFLIKIGFKEATVE